MTKLMCINILTVGLLSVFVIGVAQAVEVGPLGYWPFEDGSGKVATDETGNGHDADIVGAKWIKDGKFGKALDFDGNSHVDIPQSDEMSSWEAFTFMAWVYPTEFRGDWERIIDCDLGSEGFWTCIRQDGTVDWGFRPTTYYDAIGKVALKNWTHVAFVWELKGNLKGEFRVYINGEIDEKKNSFKQVVTTPAPIRIAGRSKAGANATEWWVGYIDEVAIFNRVLSADEIKQSVEGKIPGAYAVRPAEKLPTTWSKIKSE